MNPSQTEWSVKTLDSFEYISFFDILSSILYLNINDIEMAKIKLTTPISIKDKKGCEMK